jgi:hypothetical protein
MAEHKEEAHRVKHVWASPQGEPGKVGHIVRAGYQNEAGETKCDVWVDGAVHTLGYRDPKDFDEHGSGGCFWNIVVDVEGSNRG